MVKNLEYWQTQYQRQTTQAGVKACLSLSKMSLNEQDFQILWNDYHAQIARIAKVSADSNKDIRSQAGRYILEHIHSSQALGVIYSCIANEVDATPFGVPPQSEYPAIWRAWHACHKRPTAPKNVVQEVAFA